MKRRYVLKNKSRFYMFVIIVIIFMSTVFLANTVYGYKETTYKTVTVRQGDTLWDIAKKNCKNEDIRRTVFEIKEKNNMNSSNIVDGQELLIPVKE